SASMKYDGSLTFPILDTPAAFPGVYAIAHPPAVRIIPLCFGYSGSALTWVKGDWLWRVNVCFGSKADMCSAQAEYL
ncbi:MAG: hypothetical protein WCB62_13280, partial [Pseudolabrys sp.]